MTFYDNTFKCYALPISTFIFEMYILSFVVTDGMLHLNGLLLNTILVEFK